MHEEHDGSLLAADGHACLIHENSSTRQPPPGVAFRAGLLKTPFSPYNSTHRPHRQDRSKTRDETVAKMAEDYYSVLGVPKNASQAEIQKAYRELARKYHPDMNPDDKTAKKKFQKVQAAFDVLNNPEKREMYDRYGSSFETMGGGGGEPQGAQSWGWSPGGGRRRARRVSIPRTST